MSELAVYIPAEIALHPQDLVDEVAIPLLPASKIARGQLHPDRIPSSIARVADVTNQIQEAIQGLGSSEGNDLSAEVDALFEAVEGKADATHTHPDLEAAIATKADATHTHTGLPVVSDIEPVPSEIGQRWLDSTDGLIWFWNGSYWLSEQRFDLPMPIFAATISSTANSRPLAVDSNYDLWLESFTAHYTCNGASYDATNKFTIELRQLRVSSAVVDGVTQVTTGASNSRFTQTVALNAHKDVEVGILAYDTLWTKVGAASDLSNASSTLTYRLAKR